MYTMWMYCYGPLFWKSKYVIFLKIQVSWIFPLLFLMLGLMRKYILNLTCILDVNSKVSYGFVFVSSYIASEFIKIKNGILSDVKEVDDTQSECFFLRSIINLKYITSHFF